MKRLLLVVLMMTCSVSWAEWDITFVNSSQGVIYHHDKSTRQRYGDEVKMWSRQSFKNPPDVGLGPVASINSQFLWDCKNQMMKHLAIVVYRENGEVMVSEVFSEKHNKQWEPIIPGTPMMDDFRIACAKK